MNSNHYTVLGKSSKMSPCHLEAKRLLHQDQGGFLLIEVLIGMAIWSIGFMALTIMLWSSASTSRVTSQSDLSVLAGHDQIEYLSLIPMSHADLNGSHTVPINGELLEVEWRSYDGTDMDGDGADDYKTIAIWVRAQGTLRMQGYYRRKFE